MTWADWRDEIAKACDGSHHTIETIEGELASGASKALFADGCCFVVQVQDYPGTKACQVLWAAGDLPAIEAALIDLETWAKLQGCTEILEEGALGWGRVLKQHGWKAWSLTMRKAI